MAVSEMTREEKARHDEAFSTLYKAHLRDVYSYAYYRVGNHHDAEDLTEQAFLQAYRHFERAQRESNGRPLRPWLIRIAHNLASNYHRDRARRPQRVLEETEPLAAPHGTEQIVEGREELKRVMEHLQNLPDDRRDALIMRFALGMDNREIARALGRSDGAIEGLLRSALRPIEPPEKLSGRLEETLNAVTEAAAEELSAWAEELSESELRSLRDPRNWVRPAAAIAAGGVAAGGLVPVELRRRGDKRPSRFARV